MSLQNIIQTRIDELQKEKDEMEAKMYREFNEGYITVCDKLEVLKGIMVEYKKSKEEF